MEEENKESKGESSDTVRSSSQGGASAFESALVDDCARVLRARDLCSCSNSKAHAIAAKEGSRCT